MRKSWSTMALALLAGYGLCFVGPSPVQAQGYIYVAPSYYVQPPVTAIAPVYSSPVIVMQPSPVVGATFAPLPMAGYYAPATTYIAPATMYTPVTAYRAAPAYVGSAYAPATVMGPSAGVYESWRYGPRHDRYRVRVDNPYGPDYVYRVKRDYNTIRVREGWAY